MKRQVNLSIILSLYVLVVLLLFSGILLYWTYNTTSNILFGEINETFSQRNVIYKNILALEKKDIEKLTISIESENIKKNIIDGNTDNINKEIEGIINHEQIFPDILVLANFKKSIITDFSYPFFSLKDNYAAITGITYSYNNEQIIEISTNGNKSYAIINVRQLTDNISGKVLAYLYIGTVLENNFSLLNSIKTATNVDVVFLTDSQRIVASTEKRNSPFINKILDNINKLLSRNVQEVVVDNISYLISTRNIYSTGSKDLYLTLAIFDPTVNLKYSFYFKASFIILLSILSILVSILFLNKATNKPLRNLVDYSSLIKNNEVFIPYTQSYIKEFNSVGFQIESMVKQIKESENQVKQFANSTWEAIIIHDKGVIIEANDQFYEMFGYNRLKDKSIFYNKNAIPIIFTSDSSKLIYDHINNDNFDSYEVTAKRKDKSLFPIEIRIREIEYNSDTVRVAAMRDLTERKKMSEIMIENEKMMSLGGLAAGMAHEINNPLAGIIQSALVIKSRLDKDSNIKKNYTVAEKLGIKMDSIAEYMRDRSIYKLLNSIIKSGNDIDKIIGNMLSFSRKSDNIMSLESINIFIDHTIDLARTDYNIKKNYNFNIIEIVKEYDLKLPLVMCELSKMQQVILNILGNGSQAMKEDGTKKPRFIIRTYLNASKDKAVIEIEDNGPGIHKETMKKIFEPFFTTKSIGKGTGLGLSISYYIIKENHKGNIEVKSKYGEGSTFIISLPILNN